MILPRALAYYRSLKSRPASQIRPLPAKTSYALTLLFISGFLAFLSTLPIFIPTNIFRQTQSRLQTPGGVLLTRLAALRPTTPFDEKLRQVFDANGLEAKLLYARFGPQILATCPFAQPGDLDASRTYLLYAAPTILAPHLLHLFALGVATLRGLSGAEGSRWRAAATTAGLVLGVAEVWFIANYDDRPNARSTRLSEVDFVYWKLQVWRGLGIAGVDAVLGLVIWLQATGRAFLTPTPVGERLLEHGSVVESILGKARSLGILRNGVARDVALRSKLDDYWVKEGEVMKDVFEQPEVLEAQRHALKRIDVGRVGHEADAYIDTILGNVRIVRDGMVG